ncbi:MAG TPA: hypothetical protein VK249_01905 [Anaerolineales bacterium]|nr:hypothetical protein [Anaerolineales bacterium]
MDPATIAASATAFLAPYLLKAGQTLANQAVDHLPEGVNKVWSYVLEKFQGKPAAEVAANDIASNASDEDNQAAFRKELKKLLEDPNVLAELSDLLAKGKESVGINVQSGAVATGGGVAAGQGGIAVGGSVGGSIITGNNNTVSTRKGDDSRPKRNNS